MLRKSEEYRKSLRDGREVYYRGGRVEDVTTHSPLKVAVEHTAQLFDLQFEPDLRGRLAHRDPVLNEEVSAFYRIPTDRQHLLERSQLIAETTRRTRAVFSIGKVIGSDALFALMITCGRKKAGQNAEYYRRVMSYYRQAAGGDWAVSVAQTDVKGDRSLRPSQQPDPDLYVHVKEERSDGIVVRGAKAHITQAPVANELIVIPSRAMGEADRQYSVAFAVPANAKGLKMLCRPLLEVEGARSRLEGPRVLSNALVEALVVFDDVFVPWERVFLHGDPCLAGQLALTFAQYHRFSAVSYRAVLAELMVGLGKLVAEYNGVSEAPHVRRDVCALISYAEIQKMCAKLAALEGGIDGETGIAHPNVLYTNVGKLYSNLHYLEAVQALIDAAGGLAITAPSAEDHLNPETAGLIEKYLAGRGVSGGRRFRLFLLLRELVALMAGLESVTMIHAEGSIEASYIEMYRTYDYGASKGYVEEMLG